MPKVSSEYFEAKKQEILDAAYRVALRKSVSSMTLMDVREEAGMARGAIYRYYNNLDEILAALVVKINKDNLYMEEVDKIFNKSDKLSPAKLLKKLCDFMYSYLVSTELDVITLSLQFDVFFIHEPERVLKMLSDTEGYESSFSYLMTSFQNYIKRESKAGNLHPVMPVKKLLDYLFSVYEGIMLQYTLDVKAGTNDYDAKASVNALYRTMLALLEVEKE